MSHFSVLVIGENVEAQLQPYHEFECTGTDDRFVQDIDVTDECREHGLDWHGLEEKTVTDEAQIDREDVHKYGYAVVDAEGKLIKAINRTNPNKTWDWWVVGGRWSGFLKLKPGAAGALGRKGLMGSCANEGPGHADEALKRDVDFPGMRDAAGEKAGAEWDRAAAALAAAGAPSTWTSWEQMRDVEHKGDIDAARQAYHAQPSVKAIKGAFDSFWCEADSYMVSRDVFVQQARDRACVPYAFVKDGQWFGKGEMGWFGMSRGDAPQEEWNAKFNELLDSLPDDTRLTVVDCHI